MNVKQKLNNPRLWQTISGALITAIASYFGYEQVQQNQVSHDVGVEVIIPAQPVQKHTHKDWTDAIERADKRSMDAHRDQYH